MSFRTFHPVAPSPFEIVRRSFLQQDGLPFADALTPQQIEQAFQAEGVVSGDHDPRTVYTRPVTLWALLSQALFTGPQRSCRAAVLRVAAYYALLGQAISTNTGAYCRARAKIGEGVVRRLAEGVAARCAAAVPEDWKWLGRTVHIADGSTHSMPDTPANQAEYPQSTSQAAGVGFPVMRTVVLMSLATGMVTGMASGPCAGKETGETALLRSLFDKLRPGDVVLGDRYFGGWFMLALMQRLGVDFVTRLHQLRRADFRRGRRLGPRDHIVTWKKPQRPEWLDQATYDGLPEQLEVREMHVAVEAPGCRTKSLVVVTSLRDSDAVSAEDLSDLYRKRWLVEVQLRDIKSSMELDVLRCQTPAMIRQELWTGLLTYNLIRQSLLQSTAAGGYYPHQLSFTAAVQMLTTTWLTAAHAATTPPALVLLRLVSGGSHRVGLRPDRVEPRAVKRRKSSYKLLRVPRAEAKARLLHP
jgi:putative transposase